MESLYALSVNGTMVFLCGNLSEKECDDVKALADQMNLKNVSPNEKDLICQSFINAVSSSLNIKLNQIPIKCIFRIRD